MQLALCPDYNYFRTTLEDCLKNNKQTDSHRINAALEVLQRKKDEERLYGRSDGLSASDEDVEMTHTVDKPP